MISPLSSTFISNTMRPDSLLGTFGVGVLFHSHPANSRRGPPPPPCLPYCALASNDPSGLPLSPDLFLSSPCDPLAPVFPSLVVLFDSDFGVAGLYVAFGSTTGFTTSSFFGSGFFSTG